MLRGDLHRLHQNTSQCVNIEYKFEYIEYKFEYIEWKFEYIEYKF